VDGLAPGLKSIRPGSFPEAPIGYIKNANEILVCPESGVHSKYLDKKVGEQVEKWGVRLGDETLASWLRGLEL